MIMEVREAFKQNVFSIKWMDEPTKKHVFEKVTIRTTNAVFYNDAVNIDNNDYKKD